MHELLLHIARPKALQEQQPGEDSNVEYALMVRICEPIDDFIVNSLLVFHQFCVDWQVKALEAAEAARRKEAAKAADRLKQKGTLDKQRADRAKVQPTAHLSTAEYKSSSRASATKNSSMQNAWYMS